MTREEWLSAFIASARPIFAGHGFPLPSAVRVSLGFPFGSRKAIGQCWGSTASRDGAIEIFIHPSHETDIKAADTLTHELCHAADECKHGHGAPFKRIATAIGLVGPMRSCGGEGNAPWHEWADPILAALGPMPGAAMDVAGLRKKQSTRLLKAECGDCGLTFRVTQKWAARCIRCPDIDCDGIMGVAGQESEDDADV